MLQSGPSPRYRLLNQVLDDGAALGPQQTVIAGFAELMCARGVPDDDAAESSVADQDVGAEAQDEIRYIKLTGGQDSLRECVGGGRLEEQVSRAADSKRGIWCEHFAAAHLVRP